MQELFNLLEKVFADSNNIEEWCMLIANVVGGNIDQKEQGNFVENLIFEQLKRIDEDIEFCKKDGIAIDITTDYKNCDIFLSRFRYGANVKSNISKSVMNVKREPSSSFNIKIFDNSRNRRKAFEDRMREIGGDEIILSIAFDKEQGDTLWVSLTSLQEIKENCGYLDIEEIFDNVQADHVKIRLRDVIKSAKMENRFIEIKLPQQIIKRELENYKKYPLPFMERLYYSRNKAKESKK